MTRVIGPGFAGTGNRTYKRDKRGRFGSGSGGVRESIAAAKTRSELRSAFSAEAKRITGSTQWSKFEDADLETSKEHVEGVLRGLEAFPNAKLFGVSTTPTLVFAQTHGGQVQFSTIHARDRARYLDDLARNAAENTGGATATTNPIAVAVHEMGHVVDVHTLGSRTHVAVENLVASRAAAAHLSPHDYVHRELGEYATTNVKELTAEAFTHVVMNGSDAPPLAQDIYDLLADENGRSGNGGAGNSSRAILNIDPKLIDLSKVQRDWEAQLDDLLKQWVTITTDQKDQILDQVRAAISSDDLNALARLSVSTAAATEALTRAMTEMAMTAAQQFSREARTQGVKLDPVASDSATFLAVATALTALLAEGLTNTAGREALRRWSPSMTGDEVSAAVKEHLDSLSDAFLAANLGGALTSAQNTGRLNTALSGPTAALYASEWMDGHTCKPCKQINGKWIGNTDDPLIVSKVDAVYPNGGYKDCLGGARCRGTTVAIYRPEQATSEDFA